MADPLFNNGEYYDSAYPCTGMKLAREIATITYRSGPEWEKRFGRQRVHHPGCPQRLNSGDESESTACWPPTLGPDFTVEAYLEHQGKKWCNLFDPNSMILISKVGRNPAEGLAASLTVLRSVHGRACQISLVRLACGAHNTFV